MEPDGLAGEDDDSDEWDEAVVFNASTERGANVDELMGVEIGGGGAVTFASVYWIDTHCRW